ncbi:initiator tRNA phosphoribosyl transferase [Rhodocollybia butyracea]|uniref:Initiator tRNA phosphoribosyl transferase n=1 Tax=Rhodocollybia butyracea TaxID=206335 RepID=A0A9P5PW32_9AGAR|nr:initiator tRNA phosphoribosyl transferase [Rhodocollybia butyracea]
MMMNRNEAFAQIRKESLDIYNRLKSVEEDIMFVDEVHASYPHFPLLPNLRCGAWYTDPSLVSSHPAYFKSTDGHCQNWSFNLRRPNLHLLNENYAGLVLVDSTRSGKRMPDALSKTVPIWCAVVNRALLLRHPQTPREDWDISLHTPPGTVSSQEHSQIVPLLDEWAKALNESSYVLPNLTLPLRPIWITPSSSSFPKFSANKRIFLPIICVSASQQVKEGFDRRTGGFVYIQGSGDDHELWGMGLTPDIFWRNRERLLSADRSDLETVVASCVAASSQQENVARCPSAIGRVRGRLMVCSTSELIVDPQGKLSVMAKEGLDDVALLVISCKEECSKECDLHIATLAGKKGQVHFLQVVLPRSMSFIRKHLCMGMRVCIGCDTGKDMSVGVAIAALQRFFDDEGNFAETDSDIMADKQSIRMRLEWIISERPEANPSRNTLKRVNEFLLTPNSFLHTTK